MEANIVVVNYFAVLLAAVATMALGFLWYSPFLLGKQWMKERGFTQESLKKAQKEMGSLYGISFVVSLITATVLFHVMTFSENFYQYPMLSTGVMSAFWMWLGFVMPVQATATIFGNKNWKLLGIDTGYQFASLIVMGVILAVLS